MFFIHFLTFLKDSIGFVSDSRVSFFVLSPVLFFFSNQKAPSITCTAFRSQSFGARTVLQVKQCHPFDINLTLG